MENTGNCVCRSHENTSSKPETDVVVKDFLSSATIHGLHKAGADRNFIRRCAWTILLIGMISCLSICTYLEMSTYFRFETMTTTSVSKKTHVEFPAVTICNVNQVKNSVVECADLEYLIFHQSELSHYVQLPIHRPTNGTSISGDDIEKCIRAHSHNFEMFRLCFWEGRPVNCSHIFKANITPMGMCYTFNGVLPQKKSRMFGSVGGLRVVIDIEQHLYFFPETLQSGIKQTCNNYDPFRMRHHLCWVILHEPTEIPLPLMRSFLVGPGLSAEAVLFRNKKILLPSPYGDCVDKVNDANRLTRFNKYSNLACVIECVLKAVITRCSCRHYYTIGPERLCNHDELLDCFAANTDIHVDNLTELVKAENGCQTCPKICTTYNYDWSLSYAAFGCENINKRLVNASFFPDVFYTSSNYIDLSLFYNSLSETVVEEVPAKVFNDIIGNIGGLMGIFLGASILSIVELIEFVCLLIAKQRSVSPTTTNKKYKDVRGVTPSSSKITQESALHLEDP